MAIVRYYKLKDFVVKPGNRLVLSEIVFKGFTGTTVDYTVTSNIAPVVGSLSYLNDSLTTSECEFAAKDIGLLELTFECTPSGTDTIEGTLFGSGSSGDAFPLCCTLENSTDGVTWNNDYNFSSLYGLKDLIYPGPNTLQTFASGAILDKIYLFNAIASGTATLRRDGYFSIYFNNNGVNKMARPVNFKPLRTGKWYFEVVGNNFLAGIVGTPTEAPAVNGQWVGSSGNLGPSSSVGYNTMSFYYYNRSAGANFAGIVDRTADGPDYATPIGICVDIDNLKIAIYKAGVVQPISQVSITASSTGQYYPAISPFSGSESRLTVNIGLAPFYHGLPAGYSALSDFDARNIVYKKSTFVNNKLLHGKYGTNVIPELEVYKQLLAKPYFETDYGNTFHTTSRVLKKGIEVVQLTLGSNKGYVRGNVYLNGNPDLYLRRRVMLIEVESGRIVDSKMSASGTGDYQFSYLDMAKRYITWTFDPNNIVEPTISSVMTPQKMPVFV